MLHWLARAALVASLAVLATPAHAQEPAPLRLAIAGLVHGHVDGFLRGAVARKDVQIVGVFDPDAALRQSYARQVQPAGDGVLRRSRRDARPREARGGRLLHQHAPITRPSSRRRPRATSHVMMEKPLAVSMADARRIQRAAASGGIHVLVNYETTWYPSHGAIWTTVQGEQAAGDIRKMVAMDGHDGPKAINVQPEFFDWLTDPVRNGAGALFDFGCYGANLMTWLMDNQPADRGDRGHAAAPAGRLSARRRRGDDPRRIPEGAGHHPGVVELAVQPEGLRGLRANARPRSRPAAAGLRVTLPKEPEHAVTPEALAGRRTRLHLAPASRSSAAQRKPNALSSLENNMIVTEILEAARESVKTRARVELPRK